MADGTGIEWCDATWQPITGCSVVSPGCANCYAMRLAGGRLREHPSRAGLTRPSNAGPVWTGEVRFNEEQLDLPLRWRRPRRIFVAAHGDLFAEAVPDAWIDRVFAVMALAPQHTLLVLTKRAARMREYCRNDTETGGKTFPTIRELAKSNKAWSPGVGYLRWPLPNVWLGVSVEDQRRADERIPELLETPAAVRWISAEPLLGAVDLRNLVIPRRYGSGLLDAFTLDFKTHHQEVIAGPPMGHGPLEWVVCGGESGPAARPMHPEWARALRDQCAAAGVPFFFKQWGYWLPDRLLENTRSRGLIMRANGERPSDADVQSMMDGTFNYAGYQHFSGVGKKTAGAVLDGREHSEMPG